MASIVNHRSHRPIQSGADIGHTHYIDDEFSQFPGFGRDIVSQLGIRGEIEWTKKRSDPNHLDFRVSRPGHILEVAADLKQSRATVQQIDLNAWGVARLLHSFTGVRMSWLA